MLSRRVILQETVGAYSWYWPYRGGYSDAKQHKVWWTGVCGWHFVARCAFPPVAIHEIAAAIGNMKYDTLPLFHAIYMVRTVSPTCIGNKTKRSTFNLECLSDVTKICEELVHSRSLLVDGGIDRAFCYTNAQQTKWPTQSQWCQETTVCPEISLSGKHSTNKGCLGATPKLKACQFPAQRLSSDQLLPSPSWQSGSPSGWVTLRETSKSCCELIHWCCKVRMPWACKWSAHHYVVYARVIAMQASNGVCNV